MQQRPRLWRARPRRKPPDNAFLRFRPSAQPEHRLVKLDVHQHLPVAVLARHRVRRPRLHVHRAVRRHRRRSEQRPDDFIRAFQSPDVSASQSRRARSSVSQIESRSRLGSSRARFSNHRSSSRTNHAPVTNTENDGRGDGYLGHASGRAHRRHRRRRSFRRRTFRESLKAASTEGEIDERRAHEIKIAKCG